MAAGHGEGGMYVTAPPRLDDRSANPLFVIAAVIVVGAGLRAATPVVVPIFASLFLALLALPLISWFDRRGLPNTLAVGLVATMLILIVPLFVVILGNSISEFSSSRVEYQARLSQLTADAAAWGATYGVALDAADIRRAADPKALMGLVESLLGQLGATLGNVFVVGLLTIFMLLNIDTLPARLKAMTSDPERVTQYIENVRREVDGYFGVLTMLSLATGLLVAGLLAMIGVDFAIIWGVLAFVLNFVPTIGSILAAVPAVLLALVQLGPHSALLTLAGYLVINMVIGNMIAPRLMGRGVGLSALAVFISLILWGWLLGPVGMLVSVPLTGAIKLALKGNESARWVAILMGNGDEADGVTE